MIVALVLIALVSLACGRGGGQATTAATQPATTAPTAPAASQPVSQPASASSNTAADLQAIDDDMHSLDGELSSGDQGLSAQEGDPSR